MAANSSSASLNRTPQVAWPGVSFVISAYNMEERLGETLAAVLSVDYPTFEVIVVDDGSTDRAADVASGYPVRLIRHERNSGLASARNTGAHYAKYHFIYFLDADCVITREAVRRFVARMQSDPKSGSVAGPCLRPRDGANLAQAVYDASERARDLEGQVREYPYVNCANTLVKREAFEKAGGFDSRFNGIEDFEFTYRVHLAGYVNLFDPAGKATHNSHRTTLRKFFAHAYQAGRAGTLFRLRYRPAVPYSRLLVPNPWLFVLFSPAYFLLFNMKIIWVNLQAGQWRIFGRVLPFVIIGQCYYVLGAIRGCWEFGKGPPRRPAPQKYPSPPPAGRVVRR